MLQTIPPLDAKGVDDAAKIVPPAGISIATVAGVQVSDLVLWATLIYTVLLIMHRLLLLWKDTLGRKDNEE